MLLPSVALCNLGCSKNQIDGEKYLAHITNRGYPIAYDYSEADIILVNTCTFIREATEEAIDTIFSMTQYKTEGSAQKVYVCGCFAQRYHKQIAEQFPEVDGWIPVADWQQHLDRLFPGQQIQTTRRQLSEPVYSQYLKISEGCSHRCSFCVIPAIRGSFQSRDMAEIVDEALWLYEQGTRECILVGQDTSQYGRDTNSSLTALLEQLLHKTKFPWIRLMYLHPSRVDATLLQLIAGEPRLCSYFDIPLQHLSDPLLKAMRRTPLSKDIFALIDSIRTIVSDAAIRTSFILGFPGETNRDFNRLLQGVEQLRFDRVGVFPWSPEEGTPAVKLRPRPRIATARKRCEILMEMQREISREIAESRIGQQVPVMIDRISDNPTFNFEGRTQWDAPEVDGKVFLFKGSYEPGQLIPAKISDADAYDLFVTE